jgi:hypothetical protein
VACVIHVGVVKRDEVWPLSRRQVQPRDESISVFAFRIVKTHGDDSVMLRIKPSYDRIMIGKSESDG